MVRKQPQQPPKEEEKTFNVNEMAATDVRRLSLPVVTIVSLMSFLAWLTWTAANERAVIQGKVDKIETSVQDIQRQHQKLLESLTKHTEASRETWTDRDHVLWCLKAQLVNKGWICPDADGKIITSPEEGWLRRLIEQEAREHPEIGPPPPKAAPKK